MGYEGGANLYAYVGADPINFIDPYGLERKPGKTPPSKWPPPPPSVTGKKPRWNPNGYWEGKGGRKITWDDRSHGAGVDRGDGAQGGHWDDESSDNRWDEDGNPLPGSPEYDPDSNSEMCGEKCQKILVGIGQGGAAIFMWMCSGGPFNPATN
nr:hypothetical protein [Desulfogranum mediterraneum]